MSIGDKGERRGSDLDGDRGKRGRAFLHFQLAHEVEGQLVVSRELRRSEDARSVTPAPARARGRPRRRRPAAHPQRSAMRAMTLASGRGEVEDPRPFQAEARPAGIMRLDDDLAGELELAPEAPARSQPSVTRLEIAPRCVGMKPADVPAATLSRNAAVESSITRPRRRARTVGDDVSRTPVRDGGRDGCRRGRSSRAPLMPQTCPERRERSLREH